jgi:two-component system, LuxR family, response regulator FixJ
MTLTNQMKAITQSKPPHTVLVVDDDSRLLRSLATLIRSAGFNALTFDRPAQLLASKLPKADVCLLLDVHMPEMNGVQLYETLAVGRPDLPVIMMTGRNDAHTRHLLQRVSAVAVLNKPFDEALLFDAIFRALSLARNLDGKRSNTSLAKSAPPLNGSRH